ncbi:hypothetical protein EYF80_005613 [Liparis tanakae]|uniref:Uncharacterized protein n=1 Tax=Liparis tanakae TaxID=230148 RepID=A0A4Z2J278_9TELE|nr:hypothetical protein EYF80_005613 [Liparis tanakae]
MWCGDTADRFGAVTFLVERYVRLTSNLQDTKASPCPFLALQVYTPPSKQPGLRISREQMPWTAHDERDSRGESEENQFTQVCAALGVSDTLPAWIPSRSGFMQARTPQVWAFPEELHKERQGDVCKVVCDNCTVIHGPYRLSICASYKKGDDQIELLSNQLDSAGFQMAGNSDPGTL